ncbi:MAG: glycosyltransferase family 2 protein [bacterium]
MTRRHFEKPPLISIVAPVYNEVSILSTFVKEAQQSLEALCPVVICEFVLIDDGSTDGTETLIDDIANNSACGMKVIHLCRNFGHGPAISAGLDHACGDAVILMDSDLQDDPGAFRIFLEKWLEGYDAVYAVRTSRRESMSVRFATSVFYRLANWISDTSIPRNAGTFSLMDRRLVEVLQSMPERNRFLPGLRAYAGFRQTGVPVPRRARHDRHSRVGLHGLWKLAMNAFFSFSYFPILILRAIGALALLCCVALIVFVLSSKIIFRTPVVAWSSQMITILFFGGINLFGIGVIGEYVARIYDEVKGRPAYIIDRITQSVSVADRPT